MPERPSRFSPPNVTTALFVLLIALNYFSAFGDLDWSWQVRTGGLIVRTHDLRPPESFSYTIPGADIPDFEWLYEVILYGVWSSFGIGGLKFLRVLLVATTLLIVGLRLKSEGVRWRGIAVSLFTAIIVLAPVWNLRPLYCTTIGLLIVSWMLHDHCTGRQPLSWWLPMIMLLWANLHPGVIVGQAIIVGAIVWEWLNRRIKINAPLGTSGIERLALVGGLGLTATLVGPNPVERLLYPFKPQLADPIFRTFTEMKPLYTFLSQPPFVVILAYAVAALVGLSVVLRFRHYRMWELAMLLGLTLLGNVAYRSLMDWLLGMLALGVPHLAILFREATTRDRRRWWLRLLLKADASLRRMMAGPLFRFQGAWLAAAVTVFLVASVIPPLARQIPIQDSPNWPAAAIAHLDGEGISGNFFGPPDYGSYVVWRMGDRARSYTDTRGFFFPPLLMEDSEYLPQFTEDWRPRLERVLAAGTDYFILEVVGPRSGFWKQLEPSVKPLYRDHQTVVFGSEQVRRWLANR